MPPQFNDRLPATLIEDEIRVPELVRRQQNGKADVRFRARIEKCEQRHRNVGFFIDALAMMKLLVPVRARTARRPRSPTDATGNGLIPSNRERPDAEGSTQLSTAGDGPRRAGFPAPIQYGPCPFSLRVRCRAVFIGRHGPGSLTMHPEHISRRVQVAGSTAYTSSPRRRARSASRPTRP